MSNSLQLFSYQNNKIQTIIDESGEPWFVAVDVCKILQLNEPDAAVRKLDDDERLTRKVFGAGQNRMVWTVNESGLYNLIFRSNKPEAKAFRKWVTSEVLPEIRKNGGYKKEEIPSIPLRVTNHPIPVTDLSDKDKIISLQEEVIQWQKQALAVRNRQRSQMAPVTPEMVRQFIELRKKGFTHQQIGIKTGGYGESTVRSHIHKAGVK